MRKPASYDAVGAGMFGISGGFLMTPLMVFIGVQLGRRISGAVWRPPRHAER